MMQVISNKNSTSHNYFCHGLLQLFSDTEIHKDINLHGLYGIKEST